MMCAYAKLEAKWSINDSFKSQTFFLNIHLYNSLLYFFIWKRQMKSFRTVLREILGTLLQHFIVYFLGIALTRH